MSQSSYLYVAAITLGILVGYFSKKSLWLGGALAAAVYVLATLLQSNMGATHQLVASASLAGPFLIAFSLVHFSLGYVGSYIGRRFTPNRPTPSQGKLALLFALIFALPVIQSIIVSAR
ncbi:hypothetical protein [Thiobacillus thioparus]|uniref:hypothetical protein n=1 Tax=Thiobacillus thioparus TaxID=931 RepID=UPI0012FCA1FF|nr:hypothetical protein [Thiobacillus thioparus]